MSARWPFRDTRLVVKGRLFPKWKRAVTYSAGFMYDRPTDEFLVRETGIMVAVPELWGHIFVGRTKQGFSLTKVMVGYARWTMERSKINVEDRVRRRLRRLELADGYGKLDRFDLSGGTQFFQSRIQFTF